MLSRKMALECLQDHLGDFFNDDAVKIFINDCNIDEGYDGTDIELCHEFDEWIKDFNDESDMFPNGRDYDAENEDGF